MFPGITIHGAFISCYSLCTIAGIFAAFPLGVIRYKKRGGDPAQMIYALGFGGVGLFVGMHILFGLTNIPHFGVLSRAKDFPDFLRILWLLFSGGVFYGGLLGGLLAGGISVRVQKMPAGLAFDCIAPSIALFHAFGRVGCFLSGCCYGKESENGITFTKAVVENANGVPRVPVQLYEAAFELALFAALSLLLYRDRLRGKLLSLYLIAYSFGRFILEYWRGDDYRGFILGLSTSQFIGIFVFAGAALFFVFAPKENYPKLPDP